MIAFLVTLLLAAVVIYVVKIILDMITLPQQAKTIAYILIGVIFLLWLLQFLGIYNSGFSMNMPR